MANKHSKIAIAKLSYNEVVALIRADAKDVRDTLSVSTGRGVKPSGPTYIQIINARPSSETEKLRAIWNEVFNGQ